MPYIRKTKTPQELSKALSEAAKMRKNRRGGRKPNPNPEARIARTIGIHQKAYEIFKKLAFVANQTLADFMDAVADELRKKNPSVFPPEQSEKD